MKKQLVRFGLLTLLVSLVTFLGIKCSDEASPTTSSTPPTGAVNVVAVMGATPTLSTTTAALTVAQLDSLLSTAGPFTIFVPVNSAFLALDTATLRQLQANPALMNNVLRCHIVSGKFTTAQLATMDSLKAISGQVIRITKRNDTLFLNNSIVIVAKDLNASNGVVHGISAIILPQ